MGAAILGGGLDTMPLKAEVMSDLGMKAPGAEESSGEPCIDMGVMASEPSLELAALLVR